MGKASFWLAPLLCVALACPPAIAAERGSAKEGQRKEKSATDASSKGEPSKGEPSKETPKQASSNDGLDKDAVNAAAFKADAPSGAVSPIVIKAEVLLDRASVSPGVIDGKSGNNFRKALAAYAEIKGMPSGDKLTEAVWQSLTQDQEPVLVDYTITDKDVAGPFIEKVPTDYGEMAKLKALSFTSPAEALAERFHMDERLLKQLNPDADLSKAGTQIVVANVKRDPIKGKIARIDVMKKDGQVRALDKDGKLVIAYPATVGSDDTPSPTGALKVRAVAKNPDYTYNPDKNFKQGKNNKVLRIPPGPNNPVGTVFIALTKPTYGLHGTPEPSKVDKTESHGCVRLTNWDVEQLATAVKKGLPVTFVE